MVTVVVDMKFLQDKSFCPFYMSTWTTILFLNSLFLYLLQNFAKEFVISDHKELDEDYIKNELKKAGGANYDAQTE